MPWYRILIATVCHPAHDRVSGGLHAMGLCVALFMVICDPFPSAAHASDPIHILYINSYHSGYKWSDDIEAGIRERLDGAGIDYVLHVEFMDTKRSDAQKTHDLFLQILQVKYSRMTLPVIVTSDDNAFSFIKENRDALFGKVPVVFCGVNYISPSALEGITNITGVNEAPDIEGTLEMILALHQDVRHILVVNDTTPTGQRMDVELALIRQNFSDRLTFTILDKLPMQRVLNRVAQATPGEVILYTLFLKDSLGDTFESDDSVRAICNNSHVPVYGLWDFQLGHGIVGGRLLSGRQHGLSAGSHLLKVIRGEKADTIDIIMESQATPMVDHQVVTRFGIPVDKLPPDTRIINRPFSFIETYKKLIAQVAVSILLLLTLLVTLIVLLVKKNRV